MGPYVIYLRNHDDPRGRKTQAGYVSANGLLWGKLAVSEKPGDAILFDSEEEAEKRLLELEAEYGLNREEADIFPFVVDRTFDLCLGEGGEDDDRIAVVEENGKRYLQVQNNGIGASEEIPEEVAEPLIILL